MNEDPNAVKNQAAAPETVVVTPSTQDDNEIRIAVLEAERNKAIEEAANYKLGMLKAKAKLKDSSIDDDESDEERIRRITLETISETKLAQIDAEKEALFQKIIKENKELKLANMNKTTTTPPSAIGTHSETIAVRDTLVTSEQIAAFKSRGWDDKMIERYKKNLLKNTR